MRMRKRLLPIICITMITLGISMILYIEILKRETNKCWQELESTTQSVNKEIQTKFQDEIVKIQLIEQVMIRDRIFDAEKTDTLHLDLVQSTTIFSRIDILYPDNMLVSNGKSYLAEEGISFDELAEKGEYLTSRMIDFETGNTCLYYILPVMDEDEVCAILVGVIETDTLAEIFQPIIYHGEANICLIDSKDGNYIMDSWHEELGNAYETEARERLKGYEDVDLKEEIREHRTGAIAFRSKTTGKGLYMYYTTVDIFDWQLTIFATEDVLFGSLMSLRRMFIFAGITEALLLMIYFAWNLRTVHLLEKSNAEIEKQKEQLKHISYWDMLTCMYNRNKYIEVLSELGGREWKRAGVIYLDLNGLKQINDSKSHEAGDEFIRSAAKVMLGIFADRCYRIGGDEFVILTMDMEETEFAENAEKLKKNMKKAEVSISIGTAWEENGTDIGRLLKSAEQQMYEDKERYYQTHKRMR